MQTFDTIKDDSLDVNKKEVINFEYKLYDIFIV